MNKIIYEVLPGTPERLEDNYSDRNSREMQCKGCEVQKHEGLKDLIKDCNIGLCSIK